MDGKTSMDDIGSKTSNKESPYPKSPMGEDKLTNYRPLENQSLWKHAERTQGTFDGLKNNSTLKNSHIHQKVSGTT